MMWQIHVCEDWDEDVLILPLTPDGEYSVRSAYHMLVVAEDILVPNSFSMVNIQAYWKKISKMKVLNKI